MGSQYALDRGSTETQRLDEQHELWQRNVKYHIHPLIPPHLPSQTQVSLADVGTGTGIFLRELAPSHPSWRFHGIDISSSQFPSSDALPKNIQLSTHDAKQPFPSSLHGQFDVVHLRLLVAGMLPDDWAAVTRHVVQLLKPGGALQWEEGDYMGLSRYTSSPTSRRDALVEVGRKFHGFMHPSFKFELEGLTKVFEECGLTGVVQDRVACDNDASTREALTRVSNAGIFGWAEKMARAGRGAEALGEKGEIETLRGRVEEDIKSGGYLRYDIVITVGFKAGD